MATGFNTQVCKGEYRLQFETDNKEYYLLMQETARRCVDGKPVTNADRIRAMSDEDLAACLTRIANGDVYTDFCCNPARTVVCDSKCVVCIAEWLKHPAKDGDDDD